MAIAMEVCVLGKRLKEFGGDAVKSLFFGGDCCIDISYRQVKMVFDVDHLDVE